MARIQLTNLQCEYQLNAAELTQVVGGTPQLMDREIARLRYFTNPDTPNGAVNRSILGAAMVAKNAGDIDRFHQLMNIFNERLHQWGSGGRLVTQIIFPG